jgi:hypothetical protein
MLNGGDTHKWWHNIMEVRSLKVYDHFLPLELIVNVQTVLSTLSVFKW